MPTSKTITKRRAEQIVREYARDERPSKRTIGTMMSYGDGEVARAVRVLGEEDAWAFCEAETR